MKDHISDAVYYRRLQAEHNAKADAMDRVRFMPMIPERRDRNGRVRMIRYVSFEYKQERRRAGGYAAAARRSEIAAIAEIVEQ